MCLEIGARIELVSDDGSDPNINGLFNALETAISEGRLQEALESILPDSNLYLYSGELKLDSFSQFTSAPTTTPAPVDENPTSAPSQKPTDNGPSSLAPSEVQSDRPTITDTTIRPTSMDETMAPSEVPSGLPSGSSSEEPSESPSSTPSEFNDSEEPSNSPTMKPSEVPSETPSQAPNNTEILSEAPSKMPSQAPNNDTEILSEAPSEMPSQAPNNDTEILSKGPSEMPSQAPNNDTEILSEAPSEMPSEAPNNDTEILSEAPSETPSQVPEATIPPVSGDSLEISTFADTTIFTGGPIELVFGDFGAESILLVQDGMASMQIADAASLLAFDMNNVPSSRDLVTSVILRLIHEPNRLTRGPATLHIVRLPSTVLEIESLNGGTFVPMGGVDGPSFQVAPEDTAVEVDITSLVIDSMIEFNQLFLMIENRGPEQEAGDTFKSRESGEPPMIIFNLAPSGTEEPIAAPTLAPTTGGGGNQTPPTLAPTLPLRTMAPSIGREGGQTASPASGTDTESPTAAPISASEAPGDETIIVI